MSKCLRKLWGIGVCELHEWNRHSLGPLIGYILFENIIHTKKYSYFHTIHPSSLLLQCKTSVENYRTRRYIDCTKVTLGYGDFCHTCSLCRVELVVQFPARGSTRVLLCIFPGVLWLWHFLYSVGPNPLSSLHIYTFVVSRAFMAGAASQAGDADSSRAHGLTSGLQGSMNVHRGALLLVPQWPCISSFVFYIFVTLVPFAVWSW